MQHTDLMFSSHQLSTKNDRRRQHVLPQPVRRYYISLPGVFSRHVHTISGMSEAVLTVCERRMLGGGGGDDTSRSGIPCIEDAGPVGIRKGLVAPCIASLTT